MYRVYIYYIKGSRSKDFENQDDAIEYAEKILNRGHAAKAQVEDMDGCRVIFEKFQSGSEAKQ